jgi:two-component system cell cycle response regulator DivK
MPKILIVEDNELSRDMLSRRLRRKGFEVLVATDGQEGIAMAQRELPDLVLMDLSLPDLDGWEATRRLKKDAKTQHIPVIALTAHAMSGDREKAIDAGCDEYDTKPIDLRRLLSKMVRFVEDPDPGAGAGEKSLA